jgi:2,4-dienoyl-CoA reductase-like NADH-dependent reductase (Old Yellow Enzyme family)
VSRYFHYKTRDDLRRDAAALGLDVRLGDDLAPLLAPMWVAGRTVGNRLAIQPMEGCDGNPDGSPGDLTVRRFERFGAGGAKLIWGEACAVVPEGRANPRQLVLAEINADALARMIEACRLAHGGGTDDLLIGLQLTHSGRYSHARPVIAQHDPMLDERTGAAGLPLIADDDLRRLQDRYVEAARLAFRIGCDFVDIKQCHRYLLNELLASRNRPGAFGGSFENRTRFVREVVGRIRGEQAGGIIATRLNVYDSIPYQKGADGRGVSCPYRAPIRSSWGTREDDPFEVDLTEPLRLIDQLRGLGVAMVNVSMGNPYASPHIIRPFEYAPPDGYETPEHPLIGVDRHFRLTEQVQRAFPDLPVVGSGYSWLQAYALEAGAANVRDGRCTFVGIGRGSLAQPDFGRRAQSGEPLDPRRLCRTFSYCTALMRSKNNELGQFPTGCPPFDKAVYGPIWKTARETAPGTKRP